MRVIDLYRGIKPPCDEYNPAYHPEYQAALDDAIAALNELDKYNVPKEVSERIDVTNNRLAAVQVDLMWCFAFEKGMAFQKNLTSDLKDMDLS